MKNKIYLDEAKKDLFVDVSREILLKKNKYESLKPDQVAQKFWKSTLGNKNIIKIPQNKECAISILVPILNETISNIKRQILSLEKQKKINPTKYEIIYLVNNDLYKNLKNKNQILQSNQRVLKYLNSVKKKNVFVLDRSSKNKEIKDCNIGKARNILTAEASLRFYKNNKNGILIHTDGDTDRYPKFKTLCLYKLPVLN